MIPRWMSWLGTLSFLVCNTILVSAWNTVYDLEGGHAYLQLRNNDVIRVDFSVDGSINSDIKTDESLQPFCTAPENSTIFLRGGELYGFVAASPKRLIRSKDACGEGVLELQSYNETSGQWNVVLLEADAFSQLDDASYYEGASYLAADDTVYLYGGQCLSTSEITDRLISFDFNKRLFSNISTSTKPQPFYGASSIVGPDAKTKLVIGGQTNQGWLNMYQVATWDFDSGWSFKSAAQNGDTINSRKFALALPMFEPLSNSSAAEIQLHFLVDSVLLLGGQSLHGESSPAVAKLSTSGASWTWQALDMAITPSNILGAATVFNTLIVINENGPKREDGYTTVLYDMDDLKQVDSLKDNFSSKFSKGSSSKLTQNKAILGTILPLAAIAAIVGGGVFFVKRRKAAAVDEHETDYHFGSFYEQSSAHPYTNALAADSNSTLDDALMDSWVRKRQEYEEKRSKLHNDHWTSKDTLTSGEYDDSAGVPQKPLPTPLQRHSKKGPFSFSNTPSSPRMMLSNKNLTGTRALRERASERTLASGHLFDDEMSDEIDESDHSADGSLAEVMDVQVLVSSKRRSVLKVMNPDLESVNDVRQRVPSDESKLGNDEA